ncbi:MAG: elongation factor 2 [Archaeoglobi archaeon]|nr:elongation factor EF-2 [Candidatus Mnemosynella bozhongmuii]MDI3501940.1 elongation factor 2 [Archaeoglobi archaeon]MDK2781221.1 elongation factor 2 [Archaeoglobi archaeon]
MGRRKKMVEKVKKLMYQPEKIRNIGIVAHIDHGKTTLSDNLLAGAGMISEELAGKQLFLDFYELEQLRGITINAANVSMVHEFEGEEYLINLIDTPGHVDFGGDVTRAMRAVDGAIVVVDAVEGVMPQTETVLRQALRENVKPVLFVNKIDRMINELKVDKEEMQRRLAKVISNVNSLIRSMNREKYEAGWRVDPANGSVAFGSALYNWAISVPWMQKSGIGFNEVYEYCQKDEMKELAKLCPLHKVVLNMVVRHLPNPIEAQKDRLKVIWKGDLNSEVAKSMMECDPNGPVAFMITDIDIDPHAGEVATGRLFSGTLRRGMELYILGTNKVNRVQQVGVYMGPERIEVEEIPAGNIAAVVGLKDAIVGSTATTDPEMTPFEEIRHTSEPVVTIAVEAKNTKDLPRLIEVLRQISKEDPTVRVEINEETGEHLISGMGELHLEIITHKISVDKGIPINTSPPIVVYRETVMGKAGPVEGKSPNRHNRFYITVEPLEKEVVELIRSGEVSMKTPEAERRRILEEAGMDKEEARNVVDLYEGNAFLNMTKGIQYLQETMELILEGFHDAVRAGPLAREPVVGLKVKLVDVKLHEDAVHRGPAQVIPAVRSAIFAAMLSDKPTLLEPLQKLFITVPQQYLGSVTREIQSRRGQIVEMEQEGEMITVKAVVPVAEMFGFAGDIRSATEGRALWATEHGGFAPVPQNMQEEIILKIRERKGLKLEIPKASDYMSL